MATSSNVLCGVCEGRHITRRADHWCPECEEGLCSDCQIHHSLLKGTRAHGVIPIDKYKILPTSISEIAYYCTDHGIKYTNYCPYHDKICCPDCISSTHTECKGFLSLNTIIKTAKASTLLDNMEQSLTDIENNIEKEIQNREHNMSIIRQQREKFNDDLKQLRYKINSQLNSLEQKLMTDLNAAEKNLQTKIENTIARLTKERESVHGLKISIHALQEHASNLQTFIGSKKYLKEVEKAEKFMKSLSEDGSLQKFYLKCRTDESILETLRTLTFGSVSMETCPPSMVLKIETDKQAQIMAVIPQQSEKSINDIKLSLLKTYNIPKPGYMGYRGCVIHPNGKMILTDKSKCKLVVLNDDVTVEIAIPCSSLVNDVTTVDKRTVAVTTDKSIDIINIESKQVEKVMKTSDPCYGITYYKGTLLWCEESKGLQRMDLSNWVITTLVKQDQLPNCSYVTTNEDKMYQTNHQNENVTCYTIKGKVCWEYRNPSVLKDPMRITVDNNGNIYVTSCNQNDIVAISGDGKGGKQLLSKENRVLRPRGIFYDKSKDICCL